MVKDNGYLAFAFMVLGIVLLSWTCSGCDQPLAATQTAPQGDAGGDFIQGDAGVELEFLACTPRLIPCPGDPEEAFLCGCNGLPPCSDEALAAWCGL